MSSRPKKVSLEKEWPGLEEVVNQLMFDLNQGVDKSVWMNAFTTVYNYCTYTDAHSRSHRTAPLGRRSRDGQQGGASFQGEPLYKKLKALMQDHCSDIASNSQSLQGNNLLQFYSENWDRYVGATKYINNLFDYLNRHWVKRQRNEGHLDIFNVSTMALVVWREQIFVNVKSRLQHAVLEQIDRERRGDQVEHGVLRTTLNSFVRLGIKNSDPEVHSTSLYNSEFENQFFEATEDFYNAESQTFMAQNSVSDYMKQVELRLEQEQQRVHDYLHWSTEATLMSRCERVLIERRKQIIGSQFEELLLNDQREDLGRMYNLLNRIIGGVNTMRDKLERHIELTGVTEIDQVAQNALDKPDVYVEALLGVYQNFKDLVTISFKGDSMFVSAMDRACKKFVNDNKVCQLAKDPHKSPELLAKYTDMVMRRQSEEAEMERKLSNIMTVFKYLDDKDVFQKFYAARLSKRLINHTSADEEYEAQMIAKLKAENGYEYTQKLQRMFTDIGLSKEVNDRFQSYTEQQGIVMPLDMNVLVLATGSWPLSSPTTNFNAPAELDEAMSLFQEFYVGEFSGRKMNWLPQVSKADVTPTYLKQRHMFSVSTYQLGILLLFNNQETFTVDELQVITGLNPDVFQSTLEALTKTKVLKSEDGPQMNGNTTIKLNTGFRYKKYRINLNIKVAKQSNAEDVETRKLVEEDRKLLIQAAIVRTMKARKSMNHVSLITEVITQLQSRFTPKVPMIKKSIDLMIEKEYIERKSGQKDLYQYIA